MRPARALAPVRALGPALALLTPAWAWACPYCAIKANDTKTTVLFIAAMCLLPLVVGAVALVVIRKLDSEPEQE